VVSRRQADGGGGGSEVSAPAQAIGMDIGSRTVKLVVWEQGPVETAIADAGPDPFASARVLLGERTARHICATGYGRHLARERFADSAVTEILAAALGARYFFPDCRTILDVGGQDSKAMALEAGGHVTQFEMNDRCAAGTGRFLEVMAQRLGFSMAEFARVAADEEQTVRINAVCTVFAETEVVSLLARGEAVAPIARGLHDAVTDRLAAMVRRVGAQPPLLFCGGVAHNQAVRSLLEKKLGMPVLVPEQPQLVPALGAALVARERSAGAREE